MKKLEQILLSEAPISEIVPGNTAIVRAFIATGTRVITSYPGSPTPEIAVAIGSIPPEKRPFYFEFSINEKVATEVAYGAAVNGHLSAVFFKSVGLNVASDTFVQLGYMEIIGGMVVILGDDPGANSSQNEQDNRHFAYLSYIPVFEPATPQEVYEMYKEAAELSVIKRMPVILRMATHSCHQKEIVHFEKWDRAEMDTTPRFNPENGPYVPIASDVFPMKRKALKKLSEISEYAETSKSNIIVNSNSKKGIITAGVPFLSVMDTLELMSEKPDVLKLGIIYPLPRRMIAEFLKNHSDVKIIEELDPVLEKEIKTIAYEENIRIKISGKIDAEDYIGEYTPDKVYDVIAKTWSGILPEKKKVSPDLPYAPNRPPQMCPGCGHRSAFHAIKKILKEGDITVGDIGCHTLGYLPPYKMGGLLMSMGASTGMASGLSIFNSKKNVVAFLGDSTFFHAGLPGIINAVYNGHNVTLILMENGTTAMTGHQDHPAVGKNFNGMTDKIPLRQVLEGLGIKHIYEVDTYQQTKLAELVKEAISDGEFSVVIAKHPCMLKFTREQRGKGNYIGKSVHVDQNKCTKSYVCIKSFACPAYQLEDDGSVVTSRELCIGDASCIQTCSAKAIKPGGSNEEL